MDIMHIGILFLQGSGCWEDPTVHMHTEVSLGKSEAALVEFFTNRPLGLFSMKLGDIPVITRPQLDKLLDEYRMRRGELAYQKGIRHGKLLRSGVRTEDLR